MSDPAAWIGFAGGLIAVVASGLVAVRQAQLAERQTRLDSQLQTERHEREAMFDRGLAAEDVLAKYRDPLAAASFDLQSRLYNILCLGFFTKYADSAELTEEGVMTTLFRLAQYFGWTEILRRDIQFLSFAKADESREVARLQAAIAACFLTADYGRELMIWSDQQRAIGERMIVEEYAKVICMGYARYLQRHEEVFNPWYGRLRTELGTPAATARLRDVQHLLVQLVKVLDPDGIRSTSTMELA
jgi:hypothetical protein